jgi:hypothetical protein
LTIRLVVIIVLLGLLLLFAIAGVTVLLTALVRRVGSEQQQRYDVEVSQFVAGMQPDAAFAQRQAEIEKNLADADALVARLEAERPPESQPPSAPQPPGPTI